MHMTGMGAFSPPTETPAEPKPDGRNMRAARTRAKILAATREFMVAGTYRPKVADIAAKAGTSVRSIFQHSIRVEELYLDAVRAPDIATAIYEAVLTLPDNRSVAEAFVTGKLPKQELA
jgi:AcrR family transcriptional regulator